MKIKQKKHSFSSFSNVEEEKKHWFSESHLKRGERKELEKVEDDEEREERVSWVVNTVVSGVSSREHIQRAGASFSLSVEN